ncbi:MAG: hypothetical protein KGN02_01845 [bacterium]|nr:hypothetical protein [bacterium]
MTIHFNGLDAFGGREVALARPHPLLVGPVSDALERLRMRGRPLSTVREIASLDANRLAGAIVSAASSSSVKESLADVCQALRSAHPTLPVAVSTLMDEDQAVRSLRGVLAPIYGAFDFERIAGLGAYRVATGIRILLITRSDFSHPEELDRALSAFFSKPKPISHT